MKVCVTAAGPDLDSLVIPNIKTAPFIHFYNVSQSSISSEEIVLNPYKTYKIVPEKLIAEFVVLRNVDAIISGSYPDLTLSILRAHGIEIFVGALRSVKENILMLLEQKLERL